MRHAIMYKDDMPFRIKRRSKAQEDYGIAISNSIVLEEDGPLDGSSPGDLTKWMAVPWQSDTSSCLSSYRTYAGEYLPTFWPARVPNDVLTEDDFHKLSASGTSTNDKFAAFGPSSRKKWLRGYIFDDQGNFLNGTSITDRMKGVTKFTEEWHKIGIILKKELDDDLFPSEVWVETGRSITTPRSLKASVDETGAVVRPEWVDMNPRKLR